MLIYYIIYHIIGKNINMFSVSIIFLAVVRILFLNIENRAPSKMKSGNIKLQSKLSSLQATYAAVNVSFSNQLPLNDF